MRVSRSLKDGPGERTAEPAGTLTRMLAAAAERRPRGDRARQRAHHPCTSWRSAWRGLAQRPLRDAESGRATRLRLVMRDTPAFVISFLALAGLRAVAVPLDPRFKEAELRFCMRECGVRAVIADADKAALCRDILVETGEAVEIIAAGDAGAGAVTRRVADRGSRADGARRAPCRDDDVVFQYSAGCTGRPEARSTHARRSSASRPTASSQRWASPPPTSSSARSRCFTATAWDRACWRRSAAARPWSSSRTPHPFVLQRDHALEVLERERATVFPAVPFILRLLAEAPGPGDLSALRLCLSAASALPRPTFEAFAQRFGVPIRQLYGCTETGADRREPRRRPVGDVAVCRASARGRRGQGARSGRRAGGRRAASARSPCAVRPRRAATTACRSSTRTCSPAAGSSATTAAASMRQGRLHITGRKQVLIDVKGDKVDPIEVEDVLAVHPRSARSSWSVSRAATEGEDLIKAVVVPDGACQARELIRFARERLSNYKVPQMVEFRDEIPKSASGDVLRKYLL